VCEVCKIPVGMISAFLSLGRLVMRRGWIGEGFTAL
jgi:hypothetical protein